MATKLKLYAGLAMVTAGLALAVIVWARGPAGQPAERHTAPQPVASVNSTLGMLPQPIQVSATGPRTPHLPPAPGEVREMAIKELGNFDYNPEAGDKVPADVTRLDGMKIRLHGYMIPLDQVGLISRFELVPSLFSCCFGQPPGVQHTILVECADGKSVEYSPDQIGIEGTLHVKETKEDGYLVSLFQVSCNKVEPWTP